MKNRIRQSTLQQAVDGVRDTLSQDGVHLGDALLESLSDEVTVFLYERAAIVVEPYTDE